MRLSPLWTDPVLNLMLIRTSRIAISNRAHARDGKRRCRHPTKTKRRRTKRSNRHSHHRKTKTAGLGGFSPVTATLIGACAAQGQHSHRTTCGCSPQMGPCLAVGDCTLDALLHVSNRSGPPTSDAALVMRHLQCHGRALVTHAAGLLPGAGVRMLQATCMWHRNCQEHAK